MATEDPLFTSILEPCRLVMRQSACFYCGSSHYNDYILDDLFGIRACPQHATWATRDNMAFCHKSNMVSINQEKKNSLFSPLFEVLGNETRVKRSSGAIDDGWRINQPSYFEMPFISKIGTLGAFP